MTPASGIEIQSINCFEKILVDILCLDQIHPEIGGNKWYKLKYNIKAMQDGGFDGMLSFGGAYSNHIASLASAGKLFGFKTVGIIRGEEHKPLNQTLSKAKENRMELVYCNRNTYREIKKGGVSFEEWFGQHNYYVLPEGGSNNLAVKGCSEILKDREYDLVCCPVGTGATLAGIIQSSNENQEVWGFSALKGGEFLEDDIKQLLGDSSQEKKNWSLKLDGHRGGYAKVDKELLDFVKQFKEDHGIQLDYIYNGKMMMELARLEKEGFLSDFKKILVIHTGGIQGNKGFEE